MRSLRREPVLSKPNYLYPPAPISHEAVLAARNSPNKTCTDVLCNTLDEIRGFAERTMRQQSDHDFFNESNKD